MDFRSKKNKRRIAEHSKTTFCPFPLFVVDNWENPSRTRLTHLRPSSCVKVHQTFEFRESARVRCVVTSQNEAEMRRRRLILTRRDVQGSSPAALTMKNGGTCPESTPTTHTDTSCLSRSVKSPIRFYLTRLEMTGSVFHTRPKKHRT